MGLLPRKTLESQQNPYLQFLIRHVRHRPVIFFGLPFISTLLVGSVMLSRLTQTRYDYQATRVQSLTHADKLKLDQDQANRKPFDLREEYFKLSQPSAPQIPQESQLRGVSDESTKQSRSKRLKNWEEWDGEQVRVQRPLGAPEWGGVDPKQQSPEIGTRLV
ncbi:hypothetical protein PtA15_3A844 [Puccinia triticina]|uniref:Cytochrome c oxidase assembly protein COX16, mitochondrial n=2 Tax=Puccinia triticina TaxID=208348 RepID=A0ABY7CGH7_9BASI|nr:uncharacterized protein PtA15_3A844 [Puccinia triticina]WAQ83473.1 hypothetical protein PtA15_3A844 [Puccinia triticina]